MDDKTLVDALVQDSLISVELAGQILKEAAVSGRSAEEVIYGRRLVDEATVADTKSKILGIPYRKVKPGDISDAMLKLIPEETAMTYAVVPLELKDKMFTVGMVKPWDARAQEALRFIAKRNQFNLGVYLITPNDWEMVLRRYTPYQSEIEKALKAIGPIKPGSDVSSLLRPIGLEEKVTTEEAPIVRIVASTLKTAVERGASDIHIEPQRARLRIRFRIDGVLQEIASFPIELHQPIVSRIKILSNLQIDESRIPQDGRFRTVIFSRDIDFRVSTFPTPAGEKAAIRVLDPTIGLKSIKDLGLVREAASLVEEAIKKPFGMVLVTGPTASGKTTTLYALLQILNKEGVNLLSLEDPVEYFIDGVNQSQVRPEIGYTFAFGLRQILRQDPDVIMVGEIRDGETAELAVHAALTGQIVLATLHTNNAVGTIPRLIDMKVEPFLLPSALNLMMSQRLVGRLCESCKEQVSPAPEVASIISSELGKLPAAALKAVQYKPPYKVSRSRGCEVCHNKGVVGRVALFEAFSMTRELEEIIQSSPTEGKIRDEARRQGMVTMRQDGILKALQGMVSIEEVLRETKES
ncbi:MAG: ATPase, T2SS/T4P/T4SS family [bacterium]|nr:ATPase, T2SS/T4P/T4SS family [bacterium]